MDFNNPKQIFDEAFAQNIQESIYIFFECTSKFI